MPHGPADGTGAGASCGATVESAEQLAAVRASSSAAAIPRTIVDGTVPTLLNPRRMGPEGTGTTLKARAG